MQNLQNRRPDSSQTEPKRFHIVEFGETARRYAGGISEALARRNYKMCWTFAVNCILGLWLMTSPAVFDYQSVGLSYSDTVCGALIIFLELVSFVPRFAMLRWMTAAVAFWMLLAPLVFWSPTPAVYLMDTMIASLVITFAILVPGVPGRGDVELTGPDQPLGWTYNPSSWIRRWLGIGLALLGFFISRYLAAHQLGYTAHAWDPFFGDGSDKVLTSSVSRSLPISDAGFGAVAYIMEVLTGFMGDRARWRTAPWIVLMFGLLVIPLGVTSVLLVITQPVIVHHWCGLCLIAATALLTSVPLAVHEVIAVGQFLLEAKAQKRNFWEVFWFGGGIEGAGKMDPDRRGFSFAQRWIASIQGVTVPFTLLAQLAIGVWLMARPDVMPGGTPAANVDHLLGAMIVTVAAVATAEVTRTVRFLDVILGVGLVGLALVFAQGFTAVLVNDIVCGLLVAVLSVPRGEILERYGSWNKYVR